MCGITGYIGKKEALPIVFENLKKLEYRGYDSAGVAFFVDRANKLDIELVKTSGKLDMLQKELVGKRSLLATAAIGHSRWATHGAPNKINAHPHCDCRNRIFLVHNGIIENYKELKEWLLKRGHKFRSQTDTEIVAHLIEENLKSCSSFECALERSLKKIIGAYALSILFKDEPQKIYMARLGSPLVVGIGDDGHYIASDATALAGLAKKVIYLKDGQRGFLSLSNIQVLPTRPRIEPLEINPEQAKKGNFPHFMLKEIFEGPDVVLAALRGRIFPNENFVKLGGLESVAGKLSRIKELEIIACGTSYYAGLVGEAFFEELTGLPTKTMLASEYRYRRDPIKKNKACFFISQSGETADTLAALKKAKDRRHLCLGIVNVVGSSIARETNAGVYNHAGPEIGVASTKAFLSQLTVLALIALYLRKKKDKFTKEVMMELAGIPKKIKWILGQHEYIQKLAQKYCGYKSFLYLGRGYNYPVSLEGALKLKEISYIHAEGYSAGEMKHGPIALIDMNFPTLAIVTKNHLYKKMISNLEEIKARSGKILAIATRGDKFIEKIADDVIYVPKTIMPLEPFLAAVPLQLFAYYSAVYKGLDVDRPRNLAKSVTVE